MWPPMWRGNKTGQVESHAAVTHAAVTHATVTHAAVTHAVVAVQEPAV